MAEQQQPEVDQLEKNKSFFEMYNEGFHPPTSLRERVRRQLMEHFPSSLIPELRFFSKTSKQARIVELGCGDGNFLLQLSRWGFRHLEGVEFATNYRQVFPKIVQENLISYLQRQPLNSLENVVMLDVLEHFEKATVLEILDLIYSRLKKGGRLIVRVPNIMSWNGQFNQYSDFTHLTIFTEDFLFHLTRKVGFSNITLHSSEKWIKLYIDPRRWPGLLMYGFLFCLRRLWRVAFGGPRIYTLNVTAVCHKI